MVESALASVQTALLEQALIEAETAAQPEILSPILTNYLDTLLRSATEIPESLLPEFSCLRFISGEMTFLTPLSRLARLEYAADSRRRFAYQIPDYLGAGRYMMRIRESQHWLFFDDLVGLETLQSDDVIWRANAPHAPWFIGTHRQQLCRLFDPEILIERQEKGN